MNPAAPRSADPLPAILQPEALLAALSRRYACKVFDPSAGVSDAEWAALQQVLRLSPSSFGLQPWLFVEVATPELRERLVPCSWGQRQVVDAGRLVVFAARSELNAADVERHLANIAAVRGVPRESLQPYGDRINAFLAAPPPGFDVHAWCARQVYLALGSFLSACALLGLDACPLEGIEPERYDELLGLPARGYRTLCAAAVGHRAPTDAYQHAPKVRYPTGEILLRL